MQQSYKVNKKKKEKKKKKKEFAKEWKYMCP